MVLHGVLGVVVFVGVFVVVFGLVIYSFIHRREETFTGAVTDKDIRENVNNTYNNNFNQPTGIVLGGTNNVTHQYMIKVKTDAGKEISYQVSEGQYQIINIGDRVAKQKGTTEVQVVQKVAAAPAQTQPPVPPTGAIEN